MIPTQKVTSQTLGAAVAALAFWLLSAFTGIDVPIEVQLAGSVIIGFLCGFKVRETRAVPGTTTFAHGKLPAETELLDDAGQSAGYVIVIVLAVIGVLAILWFLVGGR